MGYLRSFGSATTAPTYSSNSIGTPRWSGLHESEFTEVLVEQLREFIRFEAKIQGHNDSAQKRIGENAEFFDEAFLGGWPQRLWCESYHKGIKEQREPTEIPNWDEVWPSMPI
ncbi:hypothetical protein TUM3794_20020 [Shewanella colwelliana]|uniref:Uncharacterized protein n=1 Tax=Shewanella colwelliana TaxID=23 RepID=A0ABQ4P0C1_SHECO|nr:hypothetical protein TUM3794_20020 [Shewanella colwelliana]